MPLTRSKYMSHLVKQMFHAKSKWCFLCKNLLWWSYMNNWIRHSGHYSLLKFFTGPSCRAFTCLDSERIKGWIQRMEWRWCSQGHYVSDKWHCHQWQTLRNKCKSNKHPVATQSTALRTWQPHVTHRRAHTLFMILDILVPYLWKHTHACVPCPTDGIVKKVNPWRVLWAAQIIHFDESVHILGVSTLKPFGGMDGRPAGYEIEAS